VLSAVPLEKASRISGANRLEFVELDGMSHEAMQ
jgi:hypothetical protein